MADYTSTYARAALGALLLDETLPGWFAHVRATEFDMTSPCDCVLGQLARRDSRVRERLGAITSPAFAAQGSATYIMTAFVVFGAYPLAPTLEKYGFAGSTWADLGRERKANLLDAAWLAEIRERGGFLGGRKRA